MTAVDVRWPGQHGRPHFLAGDASLSLHQFSAILEKSLHRDISVIPVRLPPAFGCVWTGRENADHIGCNQDCAAPAIRVIAHTAGHLALGHCGTVRDGGQFACTLTGELDAADRGQIRAVLPDPGTTAGTAGTAGTEPGRLFSDAEERDADYFAATLLNQPGVQAHDRGSPVQAPLFTCIG